MNNPLVLYLDGHVCMEVSRSDGVPGQLRALLERLDADMDAGIELDDGWVAEPDPQQRGRFVLGQLLVALAEGNRGLAHSLLIYMATRWVDLCAIRVSDDGADWSVDLDFA